MKKKPASFDFESSLWNSKKEFLVGIDEVGRGAWAGPLVAGAVVFPSFYETKHKFFDSKLLTSVEREDLAKIIRQEALAVGIGSVEARVIIQKGLTYATQLAYQKAIASLSVKPHHFLIDAFYLKNIAKNKQTPIIHGDYLCASIAAASIVAKVYRDNLMKEISRQYKNYKFNYNKGYGTKAHQKAILDFGLTEIHRTNYRLKILL